MTYQQLYDKAAAIIPGQSVVRIYRAFEGDIRVIGQEPNGKQHRYTTTIDEEENITLTEM